MARRPPRHDADAGGDPAIRQAKADLREEVWEAIAASDAVRFPGPRGRIPNFVGAEAAADRLRERDAWLRAGAVKANPDSPQWPARQRALEDGKTVFMAVPRLAEENPFFFLDPDNLGESPRKASSIKGASRWAEKIPLSQLEPVDLIVTGCVAVDESGARLGKGGGFSDLEFALASAAGMVDDHTVVVTTVHEVQVVDTGRIPTVAHDMRLDLVVTPERIIECPRAERDPRIRWEELTEEKIESIPLLAAMRSGSR